MAHADTEARLESWKEIAAYLNRDVRTAQRWEKSEGLPVHRHLHDKQGSVFTFRSEVDAWLAGRHLPAGDGNGLGQQGDPGPGFPGPSALEPGVPDSGLFASEALGPVALHEAGGKADPRRAPVFEGRRSSIPGVLVLGILLAGLLAAGAYPLIRRVGLSRSGPVLAVLPFVSLGEDTPGGGTGQDFFSDGFTEELITQLGQQQGEAARVVALRSALGYRKTGKRPRQIAQELGVDYLLRGTVRRAGNRVRVTVHLVRGEDEIHVWDHSYDRDVRDVLMLQREVADAIASDIRLRLGTGKSDPKPVVPEAYGPRPSPAAATATDR